MKNLIVSLKKNEFLLCELVKRDFKKKYKRSILGMFWSVLSPLLSLLVLYFIFSNFFEGTIDHYIIYVFTGNIIWGFFRDATNDGMYALIMNADVLKKINIPKYLFLLSNNVSSLLNFLLTFIVYLIFVLCNGLHITGLYFLLLFPIICLIFFNIGIGMILSSFYVFFVDTKHLYDIALMLIMYASAIFYDISRFSKEMQVFFYCNPVFVFINYCRLIVLQNSIPGYKLHLLCAVYALAAMLIGLRVYRKNNYKFIYYL